MATPRKTNTKKCILNTGHKPRKKALAKIMGVPQAVIPAKAENMSLVNSPYEIFAPLLELATTPWRTFFPFAPWPIMSMQQARGRHELRHLADS